MEKNIFQKMTGILTAALMLVSVGACLSATMITVQAASEYAYGAVVSKEIAATASDSWDDDTADSKKRTFMLGTDGNTEIQTSYWRLFQNHEETTSFLRLNSNLSYASKVIEGKNQVFRFNGHAVAGHTFYSTRNNLTPRMVIVDKNSANGAGSHTASSKKTATTLTYEFNYQCDYNFIDMKFYIATQFNGSDTNKDIEAIKIDEDGKLYATTNTLETEAVEIAALEQGTKYQIGIVTDLIPTEVENNYQYHISVYLNGEEKFSALGDNTVITCHPSYYGVEIAPTPWTAAPFDYATSPFTNYTGAYTSKTSLTSAKVLFNSAVTTEYTIIDTDTVISDFYVYSGNMYGDVMKTYRSLSDMPKTFNDGDTLPAGIGEATILWQSSKPETVSVSDDGIISLTDADFYGYSTATMLTAMISNPAGDETKVKKIQVEVRRNTDSWTEQDYVDYDARMPFSYLTTQNPDAVAGDIILPAETESGSTLSWKITESDAASITDNVLKFTPQSNSAVRLILTMTVSRDGAEAVKVPYVITVVKAGYSEDEVYFWEDKLPGGTYDAKVMFEDASAIRTVETWPFVDDAGGIVPKSVNHHPVAVVGPFDDAISGFEIDTALQKVGGKCATDFKFEASVDGMDWVEIPAYYTFGADVKVPEGNAVWTVVEHIFRPFEMDITEDYRYLRIIFADASAVSDRYMECAGLDGIKIYFDTEVTKAYKALEFDDLSNEQPEAVNSNLVLPVNGEEGTAIEWTSSNPEIVSVDLENQIGYVNENAFYGYSIPVTLTAKISKLPESETGGVLREKVFPLTVVRDTSLWSSPQDFVDYDVKQHTDKKYLTFDYFTDQPENMVAANIHLPRQLEGGGTFTWEVKNRITGEATNAAKIDNYILSFTPQKEATTPLTLTVTSTKDGASASRSFDMDVVQGFSDNLLLKADVKASSSGIRKALSRDVVTYWETSAEDTQKTVTVEFSKETKINSGLLVEVGNNLSSFTVEVSEDNQTWENVYTGVSNGNLVRDAFAFEEVSCKFVKITMTSQNPVKIATLELYHDIVDDMQAMQLSLDALSIPLTVNADLVLPTQGTYIGTITWTSDDSNVIEIVGNIGKVKPVINQNRSTTLTATLSHPSYQPVRKTFNITVAGMVVAGTPTVGGGGFGGGGGGGGSSGGITATKNFEQELQTNNQTVNKQNSFSDVPASHWAYDYITKLTDSGVISNAENYRPSDLVTREEFVKLIIAALGDTVTESNNAEFTDADSNAWYYPYLVSAYEKGIVTGNADGTFGIGTSITRQDAAAMLYRAIEEKSTQTESVQFTDGDTVSVYAAEAISYLANAGILNGYEDGSFRPFCNLTRAESAKIIYLLSTLEKEGEHAK